MSILLYNIGVLIAKYIAMMERVNTEPIAYIG